MKLHIDKIFAPNKKTFFNLTYKNIILLNNVILDFRYNNIIGLTGKNGVGKTLLLNYLIRNTKILFPKNYKVIFIDNLASLYPNQIKCENVSPFLNLFFDINIDKAAFCNLLYNNGLNKLKKYNELSSGFKNKFLLLCANQIMQELLKIKNHKILILLDEFFFTIDDYLSKINKISKYDNIYFIIASAQSDILKKITNNIINLENYT